MLVELLESKWCGMLFETEDILSHFGFAKSLSWSLPQCAAGKVACLIINQRPALENNRPLASPQRLAGRAAGGLALSHWQYWQSDNALDLDCVVNTGSWYPGGRLVHPSILVALIVRFNHWVCWEGEGVVVWGESG